METTTRSVRGVVCSACGAEALELERHIDGDRRTDFLSCSACEEVCSVERFHRETIPGAFLCGPGGSMRTAAYDAWIKEW